jgi:isopenicillin-N N-acyltransferase-like protein
MTSATDDCVRVFTSAPASPQKRGEEFGAVHADQVAATLERYKELFAHLSGGPVDLPPLGTEALSAIDAFSPAAGAEIRGIARGAGCPPWEIAALNARTEILAQVGSPAVLECSTVVDLRSGSPLTMQTWDWHDLLQDSWLAWTIEHPDGRTVHTVTEYGILGKIGVNSRGVGVHINILNHASDGGQIGVPVHVLARAVLDCADGAAAAVALIGAAEVSASSVLTVIGASPAGATAVGAELAPIGPRYALPSPEGVYLHTNHFLDPHLAVGDRAPRRGPDSYLRLDVLRRALHARAPTDREDLRRILANHSGGAGSICCHPHPDAGLGDRWATLATIALDVSAGELSVRRGGPCDELAAWHTCRTTLAAPHPTTGVR